MKKTINKISLHLWLKKYGVKSYTLLDDKVYGFVVDVAGDVDLMEKNLTHIPVKFGHVTGSFRCGDNKLKNLEGCPVSVGEDFYCSNNELISLEGCPQTVGGFFKCSCNKLTSLQHGPKSVGGSFYCEGNNIASLEYCPTLVGGDFNCSHNQLKSLKHCPISVEGFFACVNNQLTSLLGVPRSVGKGFYCQKNPSLEIYQQITNFNELKDKITSDTESDLLSNSLQSTVKSSVHKL